MGALEYLIWKETLADEVAQFEVGVCYGDIIIFPRSFFLREFKHKNTNAIL